MIAPAESLEEIVRAELREPIADVVRLLVVELARDELGRIAASLNGGPSAAAGMVLRGVQEPQEPPRALVAGSNPPPPANATRRRCSACGEEKPGRILTDPLFHGSGMVGLRPGRAPSALDLRLQP